MLIATVDVSSSVTLPIYHFHGRSGSPYPLNLLEHFGAVLSGLIAATQAAREAGRAGALPLLLALAALEAETTNRTKPISLLMMPVGMNP